ncbi:Hint domain-containing protein [Boseongicola sp. H5]|uniref:Hint domain-containing protein n=1 Tax=Boseongicola sp. H5 TaxID=2763261 RepID=UPI001D0A2474|nr:Hint domain-containing protein [Boseongicola sp. H5]
MPVFSLSAWQISDFSGPLGDPDNASQTTPRFANGTRSRLDADASEVQVSISDDDSRLQDAFLEDGVISTLAAPLTVNGTTFPAGASIELELALVTRGNDPITFYVGRIGTGASNSGTNQLVFTDKPITPGTLYRFGNNGIDGPEVPYDVICFASGTQIDTPDGPRAVETLDLWDAVLTQRHGAQLLTWIGHRWLSAEDLHRAPHLAPISIGPYSLGNGPNRTLMVSPQHRVLHRSAAAEMAFGSNQVLVPAKALCNGETIRQIFPPGGVHYYHLMCRNHEIIRSNGIWSETLLPGPEALRSLDPMQRAELLSLFPELSDAPVEAAHPVLSVREYRALSV